MGEWGLMGEGGEGRGRKRRTRHHAADQKKKKKIA